MRHRQRDIKGTDILNRIRHRSTYCHRKEAIDKFVIRRLSASFEQNFLIERGHKRSSSLTAVNVGIFDGAEKSISIPEFPIEIDLLSEKN